ncbi:MAG TPA: choice-of-anchor L domain-containing protein [Mycobacterium sp.]
MTTPLAGFPTAGSSYALLTTGDSGLAPTANTSNSSGADDGGGNVRGDTDYDVTILKVNLNVPAGYNCLAGMDFRFLSEEYPEFVNTAYNDAFIAELDSSTWTTSGSTITAPNNFAFDPSHNPITINAAGVTSMTAANAAGTTYDGATPLLSAATPITPGAHSLYLSIFDQGDHVYDSAVMVDDLRLANVANLATDCVPGAVPVQRTYAALGDSYSSGEGNPPFDSGTAAKESPWTNIPGSCHRSSVSWTRRLAGVTKYTLEAGGQLACSNAMTSALTQGFKGEQPQIAHLASLGQAPDLITITMGGNDVSFPWVIGACGSGVRPACTTAIAYSEYQTHTSLGGKLAAAYQAIHAAFPNAQILVVGYPDIMSNNLTTPAHCPWITRANAALMQTEASDLDAKIKSVAQGMPNADHVQYVSTLNVLAGHELCTGDSWVHSVNVLPVAVGDGTYAYSAHPIDAGQKAIRDAVANYINSHY